MMLAAFHSSLEDWFDGDEDLILDLSHRASTVLLILFSVYQVFRKTHSSRFERGIRTQSTPRTIRCIGSGVAGILLVCTGFVTYVCALPILDAVSQRELPETYGLNPSSALFAFVYLPLLVELVEYKKICSLAYKGDMDVSFEVATATSMNMLLLIGPLFCFIGWYTAQPMTLSLGTGMESIILYLDIWIFSFITRDGMSNYLHGFTIFGLYDSVQSFLLETIEMLTIFRYIIEVLAIYVRPSSAGGIRAMISP